MVSVGHGMDGDVVTRPSSQRSVSERVESRHHAAGVHRRVSESCADDVWHVQQVLDRLDAECRVLHRRPSTSSDERLAGEEGGETRSTSDRFGQRVPESDQRIREIVERHHQLSSRTQDASEFDQRSTDVVHVGEVVEGGRGEDPVEDAIVERESAYVARHAVLPGPLEDDRRQIDADPSRSVDVRQQRSIRGAFFVEIGLQPPTRWSSDPAVEQVEVRIPRMLPPSGRKAIVEVADAIPVHAIVGAIRHSEQGTGGCGGH